MHRHPPFNGLGSNTCIQDTFNLAWKIAYVVKGKASPSLLDTYSTERQPVGEGIITRANQGLRDHTGVWEALGMLHDTVEGRKSELAELAAISPEGTLRRTKLRETVQGTAHEFHAVGIEMNQRYESKGIYLEDEGPRPPLPENPILHHEITTYPGSRLPHAWLNTASPKKQFSTIDLAGHGAFSVFTGPGGDAWKLAAQIVGSKLGITVNSTSIGWRQDWVDVYGEWARRCEIEENGCILVRPDRFVCWRAKTMVEDCEGKMEQVLKSILGL